MTAHLAAGLTGLLAVALAAGCGNDTSGGGRPTPTLPRVVFESSDLATGFPATVTVMINPEYDVTPEIVNGIAPHIRVATFPGDVVVRATQSIVYVPSTVTINNVTVPAYSNVEEKLDAGLDGNAWYAVSLPANPSQYFFATEWWLFDFGGGMRGVRVSPTHPPVVASVMSCFKNTGVVGIIVRYSEPVMKAAGTPSVDYGDTPVACSVSSDDPTMTQFTCAGELGQPFSVHLPDGVTAQASGRPMAPGTFDSTGMQVAAIANDTCTVYKPLTVN